jgi:signal transduction histidine kinase
MKVHSAYMKKPEQPNGLSTEPCSADARTPGRGLSCLVQFWLLVSLWLILAAILIVNLFSDKNLPIVGFTIPVLIAGMFFSARLVLPMAVGSLACALISGFEAHVLTTTTYQLWLGAVAIAGAFAAIVSAVRTRASQRAEEARRGIDDSWDTLKTHIEDLACLSRQLMENQEREYQTISRELHDNVAQLLTAVNVRIVLARTTSKLPAWLNQELHCLQTHLDAALSDIRTLARELRPALLDHCGFAAALEKQAQDFCDRTNIDIALEIDPDAATNLDPENLTHLFRVAQESMQNIEKHSGATRAWLRLQQSDGEILLEVGDNGRSFTDEQVVEAQNNGHLGLLGMRERAELLGGSFDLRATPSQGTTIRVVLPSCGNDGESGS